MSLKSLTAEVDYCGTSQGTLTVAFDRYDMDRVQYNYTVKDHSGNVLAEGDDLRVPGDIAHIKALSTLCTFLGAASEAVSWNRHSEHKSDNSDLFPAACMEWADAVGSDVFAMMAEELDAER
jgi:hypothetical protein